ncbi:unnamed protein product [Ixodes pacificus]
MSLMQQDTTATECDVVSFAVSILTRVRLLLGAPSRQQAGRRERKQCIDGELGKERSALRRRHPDSVTSRLVYRSSCNTGISKSILYALFFKSQAETSWTPP